MTTILYFRPTQINPEKVAGVLEIAAKAHYHVQIIDDVPTRKLVSELGAFWESSGSIVECGSRREAIAPKIFGKSPVVFFNYSLSEMPPKCFAIRHDSVNTGKLAARELLSAGNGNFAYIRAPGNPLWSQEREKGFLDALALNGKSCNVFRTDKCRDRATDRNAALRKFLSALSLPCAVFAANDQIAVETIAAARMLNILIPDDLSILGVDNNPTLCEHTAPTLSSIQPDFRLGGNMAMMMLIAIIHDRESFRGPRQRVFGDLKIERRLSTKRLQRRDPLVVAAIDLIRRNACNGLAAADVAGKFPCSRRMVDKRFRQATGHSILDEIQSVRLERAKLLLLNPNQQPKSISDFCGLKSPNSLRKFFFKETGMTLTDWRKKNRDFTNAQNPDRFHDSGSPQQV